MKKITFILSLIVLLNACGSAKKAEKSVEEGKFNKAFDIAFTELSKDKNKSSNQKLIPTLEEAYTKANDRDNHTIKLLEKENNSENLKKIYALYIGMDVRQDDIISLQPLYYNNKEMLFDTKDYSSDIAKSLDKYSKQLFSTGTQQLAGSKLDARKAYKTFNDLEYVNPAYTSNLSSLISQAKLKGSSLVFIKLENRIQQQIPQEHLDEFMRISESNMQNQWVIYHLEKENNAVYDHEINISLEQFQITPEQVNTETIPQQARISDGWEYVYDTKGNVAKDSLGNDIKRDKIITVQAEVRMFQQVKAGKVDGIVVIKNLRNNTQLSSTPLFGEAKFENVFAQYRGDQRAIEEEYFQALQNKEVPFPPDTDFVKYALAEFKQKMLQFIDQQQF